MPRFGERAWSWLARSPVPRPNVEAVDDGHEETHRQRRFADGTEPDRQLRTRREMTHMDPEHVDFVLLAAVAIVVGGAYLLVDVSVRVLGLWVFLDVLTPLLLYSSVAMVTTPESDVRARDRVVPAGPVARIDDWFDTGTRFSLPFVPPIYPTNLRLVLPTVLLLLIPVLGVGGSLTVEGWGIGRRSGGSVTALVAQFVAFQRPVVALVGGVVVLGQSSRFYRCHIATGRYKRWTTHMLLESQIQYVLWYSFLTIVFAVFVSVAFVVTLGVSPVVSEAVARTVFLGVVCSTAVLLKLAFEWNRVRGERQLNASDESFTANFSPSPPE